MSSRFFQLEILVNIQHEGVNSQAKIAAVGHGLLCPLLMIPPHALGENNTKWKLVIFSSHLENLNDEDGIASEIASQFANTSGYVEERFKVDPKSTHQALMGMYTMEILRSNPIGIDVRIVPFINWRKMRQCIAILQASDNNPPLQKQMSQIFVNVRQPYLFAFVLSG